MQPVERKPGKPYGTNKLAALLLAGGLAVCSLAEASSFFSEFSYLKRVKEAEAQAGAPAIFAQLEAANPEQRAALLKEKVWQFDTLRNMLSLSGDATGAARAAVWFEIGSDFPSKYAAGSGKPLEGATAEDALQAIVREARNRQIVILNEAHHVPLNRVFAGKLARELRKAGFDYLAAEAFSPDIPLHPTAVRRDMGFYVMEPMYAGLVRDAMRDGWSFIGYDFNEPDTGTRAERNRAREVGAARNIVEQIFAKNPKAKVFIYVGYGHAAKQPDADKEGWKSVATLLRDTLGIDPLTIDQATMYPRGDARTDHPQYRAAMQRFAPTKPIVLRAAAGGYAVVSARPGSYDMQVFHPDDTMHTKDGRPLWMERQAGLRPHSVPANLLPASGRRLVQAYHLEDGELAVPADQVMVEAGKPAPALMLPPGQFRFSYEE